MPVIVPNHCLILGEAELLLDPARGLAIDARIIGGAERREMLLDHGEELMRSGRWNLLAQLVSDDCSRETKREEKAEQRSFGDPRHGEVNLTRAVKVPRASL